MGFDEAHHRLFVHASDPRKLVIIDSFRSAQFDAESASDVATDKAGLGKTTCR